MKDMGRWLGDGGMPGIDAVGGRFDAYGCGEDDRGSVTDHRHPEIEIVR